ncbi:MAG: hypothetical protein IPM66_00420 [Acidobacteriota bacterium]|nr:MAG: hypothetical protein IPM66_00420 [Acidobacteriota bacterium]
MPIFNNRRPSKKKPVSNGKNFKPRNGRENPKHSGPGGSNKSGKPRRPSRPIKKKPMARPAQTSIESTGMEARYLKELIDTQKTVVIVLTNGDQIRGQVRYYDKDIFSVGPEDGGPKMFLRKTGVRYLYEV